MCQISVNHNSVIFVLCLCQVRTLTLTLTCPWKRREVSPSHPQRVRTMSASVGVSSGGLSGPITASACWLTPQTMAPKVIRQFWFFCLFFFLHILHHLKFIRKNSFPQFFLISHHPVFIQSTPACLYDSVWFKALLRGHFMSTSQLTVAGRQNRTEHGQVEHGIMSITTDKCMHSEGSDMNVMHMEQCSVKHVTLGNQFWSKWAIWIKWPVGPTDRIQMVSTTQSIHLCRQATGLGHSRVITQRLRF